MKHTPTAPQEEAIDLALSQIGPEESNGCLIGDEPGAGKTTVACELILRAGWGVTGQTLIVGLPDTHKQWSTRLSLQSDGELVARICNGASIPGKANFEAFMKGEPGVFIAGADFLRQKDFVIGEVNGKRKSIHQRFYRRTLRHPLEAVIFDEAHAIANRKSLTRRTMWSIKAGYRMALSGTWMRNDPANMWSVSTYVWPGDDPRTGEPYIEAGYWDWVKLYLKTEIVRDKWGRAVTDPRGETVQRTMGEKIPGEFVSTLPAYRRLESGDKVPDPVIFEVDPTPEQAAQLADLESDFFTWVHNWAGEREPLVADIPIVLLSRMRQAAIAELSFGEDGEVGFAFDAASAKLGPLRYLIEQRWKGQPIAIYTDSKKGAKFIEARLRAAGLAARAWTGDLSKTAREEMKRAFIAGEFDYFIATVQSFGTGVDGVQVRCNKVVSVSQPIGDPAMAQQAIARFYRPGRTEAHDGFEHVILHLNDSPDGMTNDMLLAKALAVDAAMTMGRRAA